MGQDELDFDIAVRNVYWIIELDEKGDVVPSDGNEWKESKKPQSSYWPLLKLKEPRDSDIPKSSLHMTSFSEQRLFGEGMYA